MAEQYARLDLMAAGKFRLVYVVPERFRSGRFLEAVRAVRLEAAGRGRGPLHQRMGPRFSPRLRPARLLPQAAGQPDHHRPDRHGHRPRAPRHHRAVGAARPADVHHRLRAAQSVLRGAMLRPRQRQKTDHVAAIFSIRRPARALSTPPRGNWPRRSPRPSPNRPNAARRSTMPE